MSDQNDGIAKLMSSASRARSIIHMDANGDLESYKKKSIAEHKISYGDEGEVYVSPKPQETMGVSNMANARLKSKLPKEILESISKNPIEEPISVLDALPTQLTETLKKEATAQSKNKPNNADDLNLEKTIMRCLNKYFKSDSSQENVIKAIKLSDKFTFITDNGDIYEARLKFIKNINDIKKGGK